MTLIEHARADRPRPLFSVAWTLRIALVVTTGCALVATTGCARTTRTTRTTVTDAPRPMPLRTDAVVGECADPKSQGVFGDDPHPIHADRDLDGDGTDEIVVADNDLCTSDGNCHWNLYRTQGECHRYLGTISAASIQRMASRGDAGFFGLRGWWQLTGGKRMLMQEYRFQGGGYRLVEALLCRQSDDDRIVCEEQGR